MSGRHNDSQYRTIYGEFKSARAGQSDHWPKSPFHRLSASLVFGLLFVARCETLDDAAASKAAAEAIFQAGGKLKIDGSDRSLSQMTELPEAGYTINWIDLNNTPVTDEYLNFIDAMSSIEYIGLHSSRITDAGLDHLLSQQRLAEIESSYTGITDAGILKLADLPALKKLFIYDTGITDGAIEEFKKKKPSCLVIRAR